MAPIELLRVDEFRGIVWAAAVYALAAEGWLPDDERALRLATDAPSDLQSFRLFLREVGLLHLSRAFGKARESHVTTRMRTALRSACASSASADGAQLAIAAWWDGCDSAGLMLAVKTLSSRAHATLPAEVLAARKLRAYQPQRAAWQIAEREAVEASQTYGFPGIHMAARSIARAMAADIGLGDIDTAVNSADAALCGDIRAAAPAPTIAEMFDGSIGEARTRLRSARSLERLRSRRVSGFGSFA